jgi:uncharacterized protein (DUF427 family)
MPTPPNRRILTPGTEHTLALGPGPVLVDIKIDDQVLARGASAIELLEHTYSPVLYVDRKDVDMSALQRSDHTSWCPYKGEASYFHIVLTNGTRLENAVWTYENPFAHIEAIRDHLGFYADQVTLERV